MNKQKKIGIVLLGKTRTGKSSSGNTILGNPTAFEVKSGYSPVTTKCKEFKAVRGPFELTVVDTPGIYRNCGKSVLQEVQRSVSFENPGPHVFLFCVYLDREMEDVKHIFTSYRNLFGDKMLKHTIVLFTNFDKWQNDSLEDNEDPDASVLIGRLPNDVRDVLNLCNGRYITFNNKGTEDETNRQVGELMKQVCPLVDLNNGSIYKPEANTILVGILLALALGFGTVCLFIIKK